MTGAGTGWNPQHGWGATPPHGQLPAGPHGGGGYGPPPGPAPGYTGYPPPQQPQQGGQWGPPLPQPPRRGNRKLLIGAVVGVVVLVGGGIATYVGMSSDTSGTGGSAASPVPTTALSASSSTVRVVPTTILPSDQQVQQATLLSLVKNGDVDTAVYQDTAADPPNCMFANSSDGASIVGQALSVAGLLYTDRPGDSYQYSAYVSIAVFDTTDAAAATLPKITDGVKSCTKPFTIPSSAKPNKPAKPWTVGDIKTQSNQITWINSQQSDSTPWKCGKAFRVQANLMVTTLLCDQNPADGPSKLVDAVITNVNNTKK